MSYFCLSREIFMHLLIYFTSQHHWIIYCNLSTMEFLNISSIWGTPSKIFPLQWESEMSYIWPFYEILILLLFVLPQGSVRIFTENSCLWTTANYSLLGPYQAQFTLLGNLKYNYSGHCRKYLYFLWFVLIHSFITIFTVIL